MIFDLEHLDQTLSLFDPDYEVASIKPRGFRPPPDWAMGPYRMALRICG